MSSGSLYSEFKGLAKEGGVYIIGNIIGKSIGFILLPIFTRIFSPYEFGVINLLTAFQTIVLILINFGLEVSLSYFFFNLPEMRKEVVSSVIQIKALVSVIFFVLFSIVGKKYFLQDVDAPTVRIVILISFSSSIFNSLIQIFRFIHKPLQFVVVNIFHSLLGGILVILVCGKFGGSVREFFIVNLITSFIVLFYVIFVLRNYLSFRIFSISFYNKIIKFGFPTILSGISIYLINFTDRWMIDKMLSKEQLGIYGVGLSVAGAFEMVISSAMIAFLPYSLEIINKYENTKHEIDIRLGTIWRYYCGGGLVLFIFSIFFTEVFFLFIQKDFMFGKYVVPLLVIKGILAGGIYFSSLGTWKKEKIYLYTISVVLSGILNIILNFLFIPIFKVIGASLATSLSMLAGLVLSFIFSQRLWKINFVFRKPVLYLIISFLISFAYIEFDFIITSILCLLSLVLAVITTFKKSELKLVLEELRLRNRK